MPIHDWTRVDAGIFHDFHLSWTVQLSDVLNRRLLPGDHYALIERCRAGDRSDGLPLPMHLSGDGDGSHPDAEPTGAAVSLAEPAARVRAETDLDFDRRKQNVVAVRHASGDELVAVVEVVSKGNKSSQMAVEDFIRKSINLLQHGIHLTLLDLQPPTPRDPQGIHGRLWSELTEENPYEAPADQPLTIASYEAGDSVRAFVEPVAVGDELIDMPLFLAFRRHVPLPLETTYRAAFEAVPRRWRNVLEPS